MQSSAPEPESTAVHSHLAEALEGSRRTIERDMAALQREGPKLPATQSKLSK